MLDLQQASLTVHSPLSSSGLDGSTIVSSLRLGDGLVLINIGALWYSITLASLFGFLDSIVSRRRTGGGY